MSSPSSSPTRRRGPTACLLLLLGLLAHCGDAPGGGVSPEERAADWTLPYAGYLPGMDAPGRAVFLVRDAATARPIRGAVITRHVEMDMGPDGWAPEEGRAVTDEYGLAWIDVPPEALEAGWDAHYAVDAPGYAPTEEYGCCVEEIVELERGADRHGRITDALGRPAAEIDVEFKMGCGHSPALRRVRTDADGVFVLPCISERGGEATFFGPGILASYFSASKLRPTDESPPTYIAEAGIRVRGTVLGVDPATLDPGIVGAFSTARGSLARVQPDGSFVLDGCEPGATLSLYYPPEGMYQQLHTDDLRPGGPVVWDLPRMRRDGNPPDREATASVSVQVLDPDSRRPARPATVYFDDERDGYRHEFFFDADEPGPQVAKLPPGRYRMGAGDPAAEWMAEPRGIVIDEDPADPIVLYVRRQARPTVEWASEPPEHEASVCGELGRGSLWSSGTQMAEWIPHEGTVLLVVRTEALVLHVPFGPSDGRKRVARPVWPKPTRVRLLTSRESFEEGSFTLADLDVDLREEDGVYVFETVQHGRLRLRVSHRDGRTASQVIQLPYPDGSQVDVETLELPETRTGSLTVRDAAGQPLPDVSVDFHATDGDHLGDERTDGAGRIRSEWLTEPTYVSVSDADGSWHPARRRLADTSEHEIQLGDAQLVLAVRGPEGDRIRDLAVYVDGEVDTYGGDPEEAVVVSGLDAGAHTVIVAANGYAAQVLRVVLAAGEKRRIELPLSASD